MKRLVYYTMLLIAAVCTVSGCSKNAGEESFPVAGEWHLASVTGLDMEDLDVYAVFGNDGRFELYQKVGAGRHWRFDGTYSLAGTVLSGTYSDGTEWGSTYEYSLAGDGQSLTLKALNGSEEESLYDRQDVPDEIRSGAVTVKAAGAEKAPEPFL